MIRCSYNCNIICTTMMTMHDSSLLYPLQMRILSFCTQDGWNNMAAGGLAGLTLCVEDPTRRLVFCLFAISRAIGALISTLVAREKIPEIPYSETAFFCLCCAFLIYCTALNPQLLNSGYYHSVLKWSRDYTDKKTTKVIQRARGSISNLSRSWFAQRQLFPPRCSRLGKKLSCIC